MARNDKPAETKRQAFFGRRKGHKLRPRRAELLATLLPKLALDLSQPAPLDLGALYPVLVTRFALEIGIGGGEHFVGEALASPDTGLIGCEPFVNGMASALAQIESSGAGNVRLHHGDALEVLEWLPDRSVHRVDLLYPDPWPKRRHWKRRFVSDETVAQIARITATGGLLRFASDIADYAEWTLLRVLRSDAYEWIAEHANDWRKPWAGYTGTRYEAKALREGRLPTYLVFRRR